MSSRKEVMAVFERAENFAKNNNERKWRSNERAFYVGCFPFSIPWNSGRYNPSLLHPLIIAGNPLYPYQIAPLTRLPMSRNARSISVSTTTYSLTVNELINVLPPRRQSIRAIIQIVPGLANGYWQGALIFVDTLDDSVMLIPLSKNIFKAYRGKITRGSKVVIVNKSSSCLLRV